MVKSLNRIRQYSKQEILFWVFRRGEITFIPKLTKGLSVGAVYVLMEVAKRLSITKSLGNTREGKLALWQVFAHVIAQGSRLSAVRLSADHAIFDLLKFETFTEDHLYANLDWLSENQNLIEKKIIQSKASNV